MKPLTEQNIEFVKQQDGNAPNNTYLAFQWTARVHARAGRKELALSRLTDAAKTIPVDGDSSAALNDQGDAYVQLGEYRTALRFTSKAFEQAPKHPFILDTHGCALLGVGEVSQAQTILRDAVSLDPECSFGETSLEIRFHLMKALVRGGKRAEAVEVWDKVAERGRKSRWSEKAEDLLSGQSK